MYSTPLYPKHSVLAENLETLNMLGEDFYEYEVSEEQRQGSFKCFSEFLQRSYHFHRRFIDDVSQLLKNKLQNVGQNQRMISWINNILLLIIFILLRNNVTLILIIMAPMLKFKLYFKIESQQTLTIQNLYQQGEIYFNNVRSSYRFYKNFISTFDEAEIEQLNRIPEYQIINSMIHQVQFSLISMFYSFIQALQDLNFLSEKKLFIEHYFKKDELEQCSLIRNQILNLDYLLKHSQQQTTFLNFIEGIKIKSAIKKLIQTFQEQSREIAQKLELTQIYLEKLQNYVIPNEQKIYKIELLKTIKELSQKQTFLLRLIELNQNPDLNLIQKNSILISQYTNNLIQNISSQHNCSQDNRTEQKYESFGQDEKNSIKYLEPNQNESNKNQKFVVFQEFSDDDESDEDFPLKRSKKKNANQNIILKELEQQVKIKSQEFEYEYKGDEKKSVKSKKKKPVDQKPEKIGSFGLFQELKQNCKNENNNSQSQLIFE